PPLDEQKQTSPLAWQADAAVCWSSRRTPQRSALLPDRDACRWLDPGPFHARGNVGSFPVKGRLWKFKPFLKESNVAGAAFGLPTGGVVQSCCCYPILLHLQPKRGVARPIGCSGTNMRSWQDHALSWRKQTTRPGLGHPDLAAETQRFGKVTIGQR